MQSALIPFAALALLVACATPYATRLSRQPAAC